MALYHVHNVFTLCTNCSSYTTVYSMYTPMATVGLSFFLPYFLLDKYTYIQIQTHTFTLRGDY